MTLAEAAEATLQQAIEIDTKHGPYSSLHEAWAVLWEEMRELEAQMMKKQSMPCPSGYAVYDLRWRSIGEIRKEALDIACVALRIASQAERMAEK